MAVTINLVVAAPGAMPAFAATPRQAPAAAPISAATAHPAREVFGFALASSLGDPTIGYSSWNFDLLTTVAFFGLHVSSDGGFIGDSGWSTWSSSTMSSFISVAHRHGTKVLLTVILQDFGVNTPAMCAGLRNDATTVASAVSQVKAKGVDGVNIDYEGLNGSCGTSDANWAQHAMTGFAQKMRSGLGSSYYLSVDTYASSAADGYGFFDPNGMKAYVDSFFVMAYDLEYSNYSHLPVSCSRFCLGPTAPLTAYYYNDASVVSQYSSLVGPSKVLLGVPYYGRKACVVGAVANAYPTSSIVADGYLDAVGEASYYQTKPGSYVVHREQRSSGMERWDTWYNTTLNCTRELYFDDAVSLGRKYDLVNSAGLRGVGIWNLNYGGGAPELWGALSSHFARCTTATVAASPASPTGTGVKVTITAGSTGCSKPQYRFWVQAPGAAWRIVQDYSSATTYTWISTGLAGAYHLEVDARASPSVAYDAVAGAAYSLTACGAASLTPGLMSPQRPGVTVLLTAGALCAGTPEYRFWVRPPGRAWTIVRDYAPAPTFSWNTTGLAVGSYALEVDVRDQGAGAAYESVAGMPFVLDPPCGKPTLTTAPVSPQGPGTSVTLSATTSGCPSPRYRFWILAPGSRWSMVRDYSPAASYAWITAGYPVGTYQLEVDVRDASTVAPYDAVTGVSDVLQACSGARLATDRPSPQAPGVSIVLSGSASCAGAAQYRFWVRAPGGAWRIVQDYGPAATYAWSTASLAHGYYALEVDVRSQGSTDVYDTVANLSYLVDVCSGARLTTSPASPQRVGGTVTLTGSATCAGTPVYRFWVRAPGGAWTIVRDYSPSSTFSWNTAGHPTGAYALEVDVRDAGSTAVYDTVSDQAYTLSP